MGIYYHCAVDYDIPYETRHVKTLVQVIDQAVHENWNRYKDEWSDPVPDFSFWNDVSLQQTKPENMREVCISEQLHYRLLCEEDGTTPVVPFSPVSARRAYLFIAQDLTADRHKMMWVQLSVKSDVKVEVEGIIEAQRLAAQIGREGDDLFEDEAWYEHYSYIGRLTRCVWPENQACLLNIFEQIKALWPVARVEISKELLEEDA